ncbi:iron-containing alcohol dehydrogenase [Formosa sp. A9]|uniref:iron-containing alcohol dehydrogenase n=1 Tax=Formosa sp. A9 TaxID=3442641 RepID=UPI003EB83383
MEPITLLQPKSIVFGKDVINTLPEATEIKQSQRVLCVVATPLLKAMESVVQAIQERGITLNVLEYNYVGEPTFKQVNSLLEVSEAFRPDCIIGVGGGSVLDCAKLLAALTHNPQTLTDVSGIGLLNGRNIALICVPTTSGTGSEVSPNAILLNEETAAKVGIISPFLVPDACYLDPVLTVSLPPKLTAETGIDALSHCIEAFTNKFAHPMIDIYALKGIKLISENLKQACVKGSDIEARAAVLLGAMYGGLCLGPVNTAAVHALSYGLGGKFHVPHGLANAVLMPEVLRFNMPANPERHAEVARALGVTVTGDASAVALAGIARIEQLGKDCGIPQRLTDIGITKTDIPELATIAMKVTRLLKNNPRTVTEADAIGIYEKLL